MLLSLGWNCLPKFIIRDIFKDQKNYPFDYIACNTPSMLFHLQNNFENFLEDIHNDSKTPWATINSNKDGFIHDYHMELDHDTNIQNIKDSYTRRIERFKLLESPNFLINLMDRSIHPNTIYDQLSTKFKNINAIIISTCEYDNIYPQVYFKKFNDLNWLVASLILKKLNYS